MGKFFNLCIKRVCELSKFTCKCDPMSCFNNGFFYLKKKNKSVTSGPGLEKSTVQSSGTCRFCYWAGNCHLARGQVVCQLNIKKVNLPRASKISELLVQMQA